MKTDARRPSSSSTRRSAPCCAVRTATKPALGLRRRRGFLQSGAGGLDRPAAFGSARRRAGIERESQAATAPPKPSKARTGVNYTSRPIDIDILFYDDSDRQRTPYRAASAHGRTGVRTRALPCEIAASAAIRLQGKPWGRCSKSFVTSKFR